MPSRVEFIGPYIVFIDRPLGRGSFGKVYKAENDRDKPGSYAAKAIDLKRNEALAKRESAILKRFLKYDHENIVRIFDIVDRKSTIWVFLEFCSLGDLNKYFIQEEAQIDLDAKLNLMTQIAKGVAFLHHCDIVHRDLKPGNILVTLDPDGKVLAKITDFGLSKLHVSNSKSGTMSSNVGTLVFKAPEFWMKSKDGSIQYNGSIDVFALGLTFLAILQGPKDSKLIPTTDSLPCAANKDTYEAIGHKMYKQHQNKENPLKVVEIEATDEELMKALKKLTGGMIEFEPKERLSMADVAAKLEELQVI